MGLKRATMSRQLDDAYLKGEKMAKSLYCPKCKVEYWGDDKGAKCVCGYLFTETDKRKAMGLTDAEFNKLPELEQVRLPSGRIIYLLEGEKK